MGELLMTLGAIAVIGILIALIFMLNKHIQEKYRLEKEDKDRKFFERMKSEDYGTLPDDYKDIIEGELNDFLYDAPSARLKFGVQKKVFHCKPYTRIVDIKGYMIKFKINGKNVYGGYSGYIPYYALFVDGKLDIIAEDEDDVIDMILIDANLISE